MALRRGIAALVLAVVGLPVLSSCGHRAAARVRNPRSVPDRAALVLRPGGQLLEVRPDDIVGQIVGREDTTLRGIVESLRKARRDPRIAAVCFARLRWNCRSGARSCAMRLPISGGRANR